MKDIVSVSYRHPRDERQIDVFPLNSLLLLPAAHHHNWEVSCEQMRSNAESPSNTTAHWLSRALHNVRRDAPPFT